MFDNIDVQGMNETDVRETILRPFLERLGYKWGTEAALRTEIPLRYTKLQLGRPNPSKDPEMAELRGRPDYFLDVVSYGRWAADAKAPNVQLDDNASFQCHTYCTHPEIAGTHYLLCNGHEFKVYRIGQPYTPVMHWPLSKTDQMVPSVLAVLSPSAIKREAGQPTDIKKPLAHGWSDRITIRGGNITYDEILLKPPALQSQAPVFSLTSTPVEHGTVSRTGDGRILASVVQDQSKMAGAGAVSGKTMIAHEFSTASDLISVDIQKPTLFQNFSRDVFYDTKQLQHSTLPPHVRQSLHLVPLPQVVLSYVEALGAICEDQFAGTFEVRYVLELPDSNPLSNSVDPTHVRLRDMLEKLEMIHLGNFKLHIR